MSYSTLETSIQDGAPIELHTFARNSVVVGRYTSADTDVTIDGEIYISQPGGHDRSAISLSGEKGRDVLKITVARNHPVAEMIALRPRSGVVSYTLRRYHRADTSDLITVYAGRVMSARRGKTGERILMVEPIDHMQQRMGLSRVVQTACGHVLYGPLCRLKMDDWEHTTTVSAINGREITVASSRPLPYTGGIVVFESDGIEDYAYIENANGLALTLDLPLYQLAVNDTVKIYSGCDWTMDTCHNVYNNSENYGGRLHIPDLNPVSQSAFS